jgi:acetolactate synthase-1/2/3 large subunit
MNASDYIVDFFITKGISDIFGLPGEILLDFLYALDKRKSEITAHLSYHEQAAAFAACGYAQASGKPGVAYATKGPGFTNLITGIADCYHNSIPVIFLTAHGKNPSKNLRFEQSQELNAARLAASVTKYATLITKPQEVQNRLVSAYKTAVSGRPGPVLLDIQSNLFKADIEPRALEEIHERNDGFDDSEKIAVSIRAAIQNARRPIMLIGDGIHQSGTEKLCKKLAKNLKIPIVSSRFSQDIVSDSRLYYGYIGSHGLRYSNFILSKCDFVVAFGNRLAYNQNSVSFSNFARNAKVIRVDVDKNECKRTLWNTISYCTDLKIILPLLAGMKWQSQHGEWIKVCDALRRSLYGHDINYPVNGICDILKKTKNDVIITSDVGNNEMWLSRAYILSGKTNRALYSNNFGSLGCSLPKAIGAYYSTKKRLLCFVGDQGFQINLQELQFVASKNLPITIVVLNNMSSGMIREKQKLFSSYLHTTLESGYSAPNFRLIARAFSIPYVSFSEKNKRALLPDELFPEKGPVLVEIKIDETIDVWPKLPMGRSCQDFDPPLEREMFNRLDAM